MVPHDDKADTGTEMTESIAQMRREMHALHQDVQQALRYLSVIASGVGDLRGFAAQLTSQRPVTGAQPPARPAANTLRCHSCGAKVTHHPAEAGELLLCPICGWSEFVNRDGQESAEVRPDPVPPRPSSNHWAA